MTLATETDPNVIRSHLFGLYLGAPYGAGVGDSPGLIRGVAVVTEPINAGHSNDEKRAMLAARVTGAIAILGQLEGQEARTCHSFLYEVQCMLLSESPVYLRACADGFRDASTALRSLAKEKQAA